MKKSLKKAVSLLCSLLIIISTVCVTATVSAASYSGETKTFKWTINKDGQLTVSRNTKSGTVSIPDYSLNNRPGWYKYASSVKSIKVGATVNKIGSYAFYGLTKAKSVEIGKNVSSIGTAPFGKCAALTKFTVADGSKSYKTAASVLYNADKTTLVAYPANKTGDSYEIPSTVRTIKGYAFHSAQNLKTVTQASGSVATINSHAFANCKALEKVTVKNNCTTIENKAFYDTTTLKSVTIPPSVSTIGTDIFLPSSQLKNLRVYCAQNSAIHEYLKKKGGYAVTTKDYTFTVSLNANGGAVSESKKTVTWGKSYGVLPKPEKTGFEFTGWYLDNKLVTASTTVSTAKSHTLTAKYTGKTYTIILDANNGVCDTQTFSVTYGEPFGELPDTSKVGYEFLGWYTENGEKVFTDTVYEDETVTTLQARYRKTISQTTGLNIKYKSKNKVTLSWNKQDGVTGYEIYKKTGSGSYENFKTVNKNSAVLKLSAKKSYKFKVRAFVSDGDTTQYGAYSSVVSRTKTFINKPKISKTLKSGLLTVKWNKVANAEKYEIYRYSNKAWKKVRTTTAQKFFLNTSSKTTYKFKVRAYHKVLGHKYYSRFTKVTQKT